jgi:hypothetical protein
VFWQKKKLYCLKFNYAKPNPYGASHGELKGEYTYEYIIAKTKEKALKKSALLKKDNIAFISIREMQIN